MMNDSELLIQALVSIWSELPEIIGTTVWSTFQERLLQQLRALEGAAAAEEVDAETDALLEIFDDYPAARSRLVTAYSALASSIQRAAARRTPPIAGAVKHARYLDIPIFYATDRAPAAPADAEPYFTGDRGHLSYGVAHVSVPDDHQLGAIEQPKWWKLQFRNTPEEFVLVLGVEHEDRTTFVGRARACLAKAGLPEVLIFVHGYNVSFASSLRRAAQIAYDLQFGGLMMLYSWPSEGATLRYPVDKANAIWSLPRFREFLSLVLSQLGAQRVNAVAHSMGNEVLLNGVAGFDVSALPCDSASLHEIVLAAPDVDAGQFRDLAREFRSRARRYTLYASSNDKALLISQGVQKYPRAGQSGDGLILVDGVETIDATELDTGLIGHSYIGDHTSILSDVYNLLRGVSPDARFGLDRLERGDHPYWTFRKIARE
jgi:esterase/lipase superfamily enzyme